MTSPTSKHYYGLEWLRFLMALYMVVYHLGGLYGDAPALFHQLVGMGFYATSTFFLLSGFLLAHVCLDDDGGMKGSRAGFLARRLCNLYPLHLLTLAIALGVLIWRGSMGDGVNVAYNTHPYAGTSDDLLPPLGGFAAGLHVLMQLFLLQSWEPRFLWLNGATWSISALLFFYLLFPLLAPRLMAARRWLALGLGLWGLYLLAPAIATWFEAFDHVTVGLIHRNPLVRLPEFLIGVLLYRALKEDWVARTVARQRLWLMLVGLGGLLLGAWLLNQDGRRWFYLVHNGLLTPFQSMLLLGCSTFGAPATRSWRQVAQRLGNASLCIFIIHTPLISLIAPTTRQLIRWLDQTHEAATDLVGDAVEEVIEIAVTIPVWALIPHLLLIVALGLLTHRYLAAPLRRRLETCLPERWQARQRPRD